MGEKSPIGIRRNMDIKLTNGKKTITRSKEAYEANKQQFKMRGFVPFEEVKKEVKKSTLREVVENVVKLKPKKKKNVKKTKKKT